MKLKLAMGIIAALLAGTLLGACGDGGGQDGAAKAEVTPAPGPPLTLRQYFDELREAFVRLESNIASLSEPTGADDSADMSAVIADVARSLASLSQATATFRDEVLSLNPPPEVAAKHQAFAAALVEEARLIRELSLSASGAGTLEELTEIFQEAEGLQVGARERCLDLQAVAEANGVPVDLPCEE